MWLLCVFLKIIIIMIIIVFDQSMSSVALRRKLYQTFIYLSDVYNITVLDKKNKKKGLLRKPVQKLLQTDGAAHYQPPQIPSSCDADCK